MPSWLVREVSTLIAFRVCSCAAAGGVAAYKLSREAAMAVCRWRRLSGFCKVMKFPEGEHDKMDGQAQLYEEIKKFHT